MAKNPLLLKAVAGLILTLPLFAVASDRDDCVRAALMQALQDVQREPPGFFARLRNFEANVQMGDRGSMRQLISDGIVRPASIEHLAVDLSDPRLQGSGVETTLLLSSSGDAVRIHQSPTIGQGRALLERNGRVYLVELGVERSAPVGSDSHSMRFQLPSHSGYQEGVEWSNLSDEARNHLTRAMGTRQVVAQNYRDATRTEAVPLRVRMPTGRVFTQVNEPAFQRLGISWRDENTGLVWSQAIEGNMDSERATAACANFGGRLPSISELGTWVSHLGRSNNQLNSLFPRDARFFWSSSHVFGSSYYYVRFMSGVSGETGGYDGYRNNYYHGARCVR